MMRTKRMIQAAVIAAAYAVLTVALSPISYGVMQVRISEALVVLPAFTPAAVPGLFVGCLVANFVSPYGLLDMIFGSAASLIGALGSYALRERPLLVPLPPVVANGVIVGAMMKYAYGIPLPLWSCIGWVALGEFVSCYALGYPLMRYLERRKRIFE